MNISMLTILVFASYKYNNASSKEKLSLVENYSYQVTKYPKDIL